MRPLPALDRADLGRRVASVAEAGRRAGFAVAVPRALGEPDGVYVADGGVVSLAYSPRPGLARDAQTGLGLLVTELRATGVAEYIAQAGRPGDPRRAGARRRRPGRLSLRGAARAAHRAARPQRAPAAARLAGNTLAFERGSLVVRLEGRFGREQALALARSVGRAAERQPAAAAAARSPGFLQPPVLFSPNAQKCLIVSQFFTRYWPVPMRTRAVSLPGPQSIVPLP